MINLAKGCDLYRPAVDTWLDHIDLQAQPTCIYIQLTKHIQALAARPITAMKKISGRPPPPVTRTNGDQTKEKILHAAEVLFGENGYDMVSLRDITGKAGVTLALASYHFGTKDNLFKLVISRRAETLNTLRRQRLEKLREDNDLTLRAILDAFMEPLFAQMRSSDEGWPSYVMLLSKLGQSNRWIDILRENFDETATLFIGELRKILPKASEEDLLRTFSLVLHLMLVGVSNNQRLDTLSGGIFRAADLDKTYDVLLRFAVAGMESIRN